MGRSLDWRTVEKLEGNKFDSVSIEDVDIVDMEKRKRELVNEHKPIYNKLEERKKKVVVPMVRVVGIHKGSNLAEKLKYCGDNNISMAELNERFKKQ